jgi:predicted DNA-binding transcriptional regulator YafY
VVIEPETPKQEKKQNTDVMSVWCLDKKSWRSFRISNIISAKVKE